MLSSLRSCLWAYHTDATTHSTPHTMLSSLLRVGVSHRRPLNPQSFIAPQAGRRVVWEDVKRTGGGVGPLPGGRERPSSTCRRSAHTYGVDFPLHPPHDAVPAVRTQQPCDDNIRCRDIINPRSTHFVSRAPLPEFEHTRTDPLLATGRVASDGL